MSHERGTGWEVTMARSEYQVYKRSGSPFYYMRFWDEEARSYTGGKSTEEKQKGRALGKAKEEYEAGGFRARSEDPQVFDFLLGFWKDPPRKVSEGHRRRSLSFIENHVKDFTGFKGRRLSQIRPPHLNRLFDHLQAKSMTPRQVNLCMMAVGRALRWARSRGKLYFDPMAGVEKAEEHPRERGALTLDEIGKITALEVKDLRAKTGTLLGALAGLRLGEIRALQWGDVDFIKHEIGVIHNYVDLDGDKEPKRGSAGRVLLVEPLAHALEDLRAASTWKDPEDKVIYSRLRGHPVEVHHLQDGFAELLRAIGIDDAERKKRHLSFHSTRHSFTSWARLEVPDFVAMKLTRHKSPGVFEKYSHVDHGQDDEMREKLNRRLAGGEGGKTG